MEINERVNGKCECDVELEAVDTAIVIRDPYWGDIKGDIYKQEDLQQEFSLYRKKDDQDVIDNEIKDGLANEVTRATTAEGKLRTDLDAEVQRATNAESELRTDLETETSSRISEDNALSSRIDSEASSRESNDNILNEKIRRPCPRSESRRAARGWQAFHAHPARGT